MATSHADLEFNHEELKQRCLNNQALAQRVVAAFLASGMEVMTTIQESVRTQQWEDLARAAHRLKGASDNVAAGRLSQLAAEIQKQATQPQADFEEPIAALREAWQRFEVEARAFLAAGNDVETGNQSD